MDQQERESLAEWCALRSNYTPEYYLNMSDEELIKIYDRLIEEDAEE